MELQLAPAHCPGQLSHQPNPRHRRKHLHPGRRGGIYGEDVFLNHGKTFQNLSLYEQRISRTMHKNLKEFQEFQDRRKADEDRRKAEERQTPSESATKPKAFAASAGAQSGQEEKSDNENEFVFRMPKRPLKSPLLAPQISIRDSTRPVRKLKKPPEPLVGHSLVSCGRLAIGRARK